MEALNVGPKIGHEYGKSLIVSFILVLWTIHKHVDHDTSEIVVLFLSPLVVHLMQFLSSC